MNKLIHKKEGFHRARQSLKVVMLTAALVFVSGPGLANAASDDVIMGDGLGEQFGHVTPKVWQEAEVPLPAAPDNRNLMPVKIFEMPHYKYYIDSQSLNVSAGDNIARYTVIIEPSSGLRNVFFEGIRCDTSEYKIYASSLWGQALSPIQASQWSRIVDTGVGVYRYDLFRYFLCSNSIIRGKKSEILRLIESPPDNFTDEVLE